MWTSRARLSRSRGRSRKSASWCRTWNRRAIRPFPRAERGAAVGAPMAPGPLIILSGPSGSGKSTLIARLLEDKSLPLRLSVSTTTRAPRPREIDGVHYHFWTRERFLREREQGGFLEWAEVHGNLYGTP